MSACAPVGIFLTDRDGKCTYTNVNCQAICHLEIQQDWQQELGKLIHPEERDRILETWSNHSYISRTLSHEFRIYSPDGSLRWLHIRISPMLSETSKFLGHVCTIEDITDRKLAEESIKQLNNLLEQKVEERTEQLSLSNQKLAKEIEVKEILLKEVHHRVKNNLQIISSLLNLQSRSLGDRKTVSIFQESQNRVKTMALVHEKLYRATDLSQIDFGEYIRDLTVNLFHSYKLKEDTLVLKTEVEPIFLNVDRALSCGLIVNELVYNAIKYAFSKDDYQGKISIHLSQNSENTVVLIVKDNGIGLPSEFSFENARSLGLRLVHNLVNQLRGSININSRSGTEFQITFPLNLKE